MTFAVGKDQEIILAIEKETRNDTKTMKGVTLSLLITSLKSIVLKFFTSLITILTLLFNKRRGWDYQYLPIRKVFLNPHILSDTALAVLRDTRLRNLGSIG